MHATFCTQFKINATDSRVEQPHYTPRLKLKTRKKITYSFDILNCIRCDLHRILTYASRFGLHVVIKLNYAIYNDVEPFIYRYLFINIRYVTHNYTFRISIYRFYSEYLYDYRSIRYI